MTPTTAIPMLICQDADSEIAFCTQAFGAVELSRRLNPDGSVLHATLKLGGAIVMVHSEVTHLASRAPTPDGSSSVVIYLLVDDADVTFAQSTAAGARAVLPLNDEAWGYRVGRVVDPAGHVWNIAARLASSRSP